MVKRKDSLFDHTDLNIPKANDRGLIHRDYIAHCFRWSFVKDFITKRDKEWTGTGCVNSNRRHKHAHVLDVGCGQDLMLYRVLNSNKKIPLSYTGIDINKIEPLEAFKGSRLQPTLIQSPFCEVKTSDLENKPNIVVSFEVLEHVPREYSARMLKHMYDLSTDNAYAIISTPVYYEKYGMADNHINEMTREELIEQIDDAGWKVKENYGTFAGLTELRPVLDDSRRELLEQLNQYFSADVLSNFMAPLYPEASRNNLWLLTKERS